jgi:hypothetical protein
LSTAIVIGQSHVNAIAEALGEDTGALSKISLYRLESKGGVPEPGAISTGEAVEIVAGLAPTTAVFLSVLGTYHNILGLLRSGGEFDFLLSCDDVVGSEGATQIPHRAIANAFETVFSESKTMRRLWEAAKSPLYLLSAPPPKECNQYIVESFMRQKKPKYRGKSVKEIGIEAPERRAKLWLIETRLLRSWAESQGMEFVAAPQRALSKGGFLNRDYYSTDVTHANAAYGALVLEQIEEIVQAQVECSVHG